MPWLKRTLLLLLIVTGIVVLGKYIPQGITDKNFLKKIFPDENKSDKPSLTKKIKAKVFGEKKGNDSWKQQLLDSLKLKYQLGEKELTRQTSSQWTVKLPRGKSLVNYSLDLFQLCKVLEIEGLQGTVKKSSVPTYFFTMKKEGHDFALKFRYSKRYLQGTSRLSLVFNKMDSLKPRDMTLLDNLNWSHTIIVNPNTSNKFLLKHARAGNSVVLTRLSLEPFEYPYRNPGEGTILIHHSKYEIEKMLLKKLNLLKRGVGFATYYGSRAVENKKFLGHLARFMQSKNLAFLDLTDSQRSYSLQVTREFEVLCRKAKIYSGENSLHEYLTHKLLASTRYGEALAVMPFSPERVRKIDTFLNEKNLRSMGIEVVAFSDLEHY